MDRRRARGRNRRSPPGRHGSGAPPGGNARAAGGASGPRRGAPPRGSGRAGPGTRGQGEAVDASLPDPVYDAVSRRRDPLLDLAAGGADPTLVARGHVGRDVVVSEVGGEIATRVVRGA